MNDDMHELQDQLEEAGFGDNQSDEFDMSTSKGNKLMAIPGKGGKKIMNILKKSRKIVAATTDKVKNTVDFRNQGNDDPEKKKKDKKDKKKDKKE